MIWVTKINEKIDWRNKDVSNNHLILLISVGNMIETRSSHCKYSFVSCWHFHEIRYWSPSFVRPWKIHWKYGKYDFKNYKKKILIIYLQISFDIHLLGWMDLFFVFDDLLFFFSRHTCINRHHQIDNCKQKQKEHDEK